MAPAEFADRYGVTLPRDRTQTIASRHLGRDDVADLSDAVEVAEAATADGRRVVRGAEGFLPRIRRPDE